MRAFAPQSVFQSTPFLAFELVLSMLVMPVMVWLILSPRAILPVVMLMAGVCYWLARKSDPTFAAGRWHVAAFTRANVGTMLARFAVCALLIMAATAFFKPDMLFGFIREKPVLWALVMVLYPLISVVPQEIIYRRYVFARFSRLFASPMLLMLVSGLAFGFAHVVFDNSVAPALCAVGGLMFAYTYHKTRSLALVCVEHALYGNFIFTVGLGRYFYHGAVGVVQ
jgi:uncharacterized protein